MQPGENNTAQFFAKLDSIQRDVIRQNLRLERLAVTQENQTTTLSELATTLKEVTARIPALSTVADQQEELKGQVLEHDRKISEHTGRWVSLDTKKRPTPYHGTPRPSFPPKMPAFKDLKDMGNILRLIALVAVLSAGITAALAAGNKMGWIGEKTSEVEQLPPSEVEEFLEELKRLQALVEDSKHPRQDASLSYPGGVDNE